MTSRDKMILREKADFTWQPTNSEYKTDWNIMSCRNIFDANREPKRKKDGEGGEGRQNNNID